MTKTKRAVIGLVVLELLLIGVWVLLAWFEISNTDSTWTREMRLEYHGRVGEAIGAFMGAILGVFGVLIFVTARRSRQMQVTQGPLPPTSPRGRWRTVGYVVLALVLVTGAIGVAFWRSVGDQVSARLYQGYERGFKASVKKNIVQSCIGSATAQGVDDNTARVRCDCFADYVVNKYSSSELRRLESTSESPETQKVLEEATRSCQ